MGQGQRAPGARRAGRERVLESVRDDGQELQQYVWADPLIQHPLVPDTGRGVCHQHADGSPTIHPGKTNTAEWHFKARASTFARSTPRFTRSFSIADKVDWGIPVRSDSSFWLSSWNVDHGHEDLVGNDLVDDPVLESEPRRSSRTANQAIPRYASSTTRRRHR